MTGRKRAARRKRGRPGVCPGRPRVLPAFCLKRPWERWDADGRVGAGMDVVLIGAVGAFVALAAIVVSAAIQVRLWEMYERDSGEIFGLAYVDWILWMFSPYGGYSGLQLIPLLTSIIIIGVNAFGNDMWRIAWPMWKLILFLTSECVLPVAANVVAAYCDRRWPVWLGAGIALAWIGVLVLHLAG